MSDIEEGAPTGEGTGNTHRIDIGGDAGGPVIAGDHNVVVDAQHGSRVTVLVGGQRPRPRRRPRVALPPRQLSEPLGLAGLKRRVAAAIDAGEPVQLWGPPGIGKSTLIRHLARTLPPGPDGVVFLSALRRDVIDLAQDLFEACYEAPGYAPKRSELRRLLTGVRVRVYVDDANLSSDQMLELLDAAPDASFVFASAERTLWSGGTAIELHGLARRSGIALLARELGGRLSEAERRAAGVLWEAAAGRPLPLLRAAAVAAMRAHAGERTAAGRLPRPAEVDALLPTLLDRLAEQEPNRRALHLLATLDGTEVAGTHVGELAGVEEPAELCDHLVSLGLARAGEYGYALQTDVVAEVRRRFPGPVPVERLCEHFIRWAAREQTTPEQLAVHAPVLAKVAQLAESAGRADLSVELARATSPGLARSLRFGAWGRLLGRGWGAARSAGDRRAEAFFLHEEAIRALLIGRRAVYTALLAQAGVLGYVQAGDAGSATLPALPTAAPPPHHGGGNTTAEATGARPDIDVESYMQSNGFTPADAGHATGVGQGSRTETDSSGSWGDALTGKDDIGALPDDGGGSLSAGHGISPASAGDGGGSAAGRAGGGSAAAKAGGATAAAAGGGGSFLSGLVTLAVCALVVYGIGSAVRAYTDQEETASSSQSDPESTTEWGSSDGSTGTSGGTSWPPIEDIEEWVEPPTRDLAGIWQLDGGGMLEFVETSPGTYRAEVYDECGGIGVLEFTGYDGHYTGSSPLYNDDDPCGEPLGEVTNNIVVGTDGETAEWTSEVSWEVEESTGCLNCEPETMTRVE